MDAEKSKPDKARTGVPGLDDILAAGLTVGHVFLLEGNPGTGKTTIALRFLLEGAAAGERCLYITLSETEQELRNGAASHGWSIDGNIEVFELARPRACWMRSSSRACFIPLILSSAKPRHPSFGHSSV
jgi:circadian clock protein KaiC